MAIARDKIHAVLGVLTKECFKFLSSDGVTIAEFKTLLKSAAFATKIQAAFDSENEARNKILGQFMARLPDTNGWCDTHIANKVPGLEIYCDSPTCTYHASKFD